MTARLPYWFNQKAPDQYSLGATKRLIDGLSLHTVCESAVCPNIGECFSNKTATFLILGDICTRHCRFCSVKKGHPLPLDDEEPHYVCEAVDKLHISYVVITSVTRDDLADGGASQFAKVISALREKQGCAVVEVLIPDFQGSTEALKTVVAAQPQVIDHNVEMIPRLYKDIRPMADYGRSLELLYSVKKLDTAIVTKSGLMLGFGESKREVIEVMEDLREANCDLLTIGQYLPPSSRHHPVARYVPPGEFTEYSKIGKKLGFVGVASAPLVRSSFRAAELYAAIKRHKE